MANTDKRVVFGVEVDINDYYDSNKQPKIKPFKQYKGTFSHFGWYDVSQHNDARDENVVSQSEATFLEEDLSGNTCTLFLLDLHIL